jgi:hypothetical protein
LAEWLRGKFGKGQKQSYDPAIEGYTAQLLASQEPPDAASQSSRDALEINIHTIEDPGLTHQLDALSIQPEQRYSYPIYDPLCSGKVLRNEVVTVPARPVSWALALRVAISTVTPTRFITKKQAMMYKNRLRADVLRIKRNMSREDRKLFLDYINQIETFCCESIDDSVDGQKMLALKTTGKSMRVRVNNNNESFGDNKR